LIFNVTGTLTVGASGKIHMDAKGYHGGVSGRSQGGSPTGPGTTSAAANGGGGGGNGAGDNGTYAGGGSYGTQGALGFAGSTPGSIYGADDFVEKLYLGSGGGLGYYNTHAGGAGGGAIKISATNVSLASGAQITARGGDGAHTTFSGGGSGGTIVFAISGTYTNSGGTISAAGGAGVQFGGDGRISFPSNVLIDGSNNLTVAGIRPINIHLTSSINTFTVGANATVNLTADTNVTVSSLVINGANAVVNVNSEWAQESALTQEPLGRSFGSVTVTNGILTSAGYANTHSGGSWTTTPGAGNGRLIFETGTLTVGASGRVHMDAKGYHGGVSGRSQGGSPVGPGTASAAANGGGGGGQGFWGAAGSYGTQGWSGSDGAAAGSVYGADNFMTQLHLGSGGGAGWLGGRPGGYGGGAIKISATNISLASGAQVTARGGTAPDANTGGSGSGGTIVFSISGTYTNSGATISVAGGSVRIGGDGRMSSPPG
jgi:hypothetical protein